MDDTLLQKVMAIIADTEHIPLDRITPESSFEELGVDSLGSLSIIFELESKFNINIPDQEAYGIRNVHQAVESLQKLLAEAPSDAGSVQQD